LPFLEATFFVHFSYTYIRKDTKMRLLSRKEELILLAVWKLQDQDQAYGVTIREYIEKMSGIRWLFGAIYSPLARLVEHGYVESYESEPIRERGGRKKILYRLTADGKKALVAVKELHASIWDDIYPIKETSD